MFSASRASAALYFESASNMKTWPHLQVNISAQIIGQEEVQSQA